MRGAPGTEAVVKEVRIGASPETVFGFFTDPEKLTRWLCEEATVDPRPGGVNHQRHLGDEDNPNGPYFMRGTFVEVSPPRRAVFTWGYENEEVGVPPGSSTVEVTLEPNGEGTLLRLVHRDLPEAGRGAHARGWEKMLARLARRAGHHGSESERGDVMRVENVPSVRTEMLIRRPVGEVFQAFVDPEVTTRFWFTESSGELEPGAEVRWEWGMYGASTTVSVKEFEEGSRILVEWDPESPREVEWRFFPGENGTTFVRITETGFEGTGDEIVAQALDSKGGFTIVLAAAKALLEHDVVLTLVADAHPEGFDS